MFHREILNDDQVSLLPVIKEFKREYYLVGGTAIALYLGHRRSIDFDLFKFSTLNAKKNIEKLNRLKVSFAITRNVTEQLNLIASNVKLTFFQYPFQIEAKNDFEKTIRLPELLDLTAMKAYALGRRSKWKDYVDLYFLLKNEFSLQQITDRATLIFGDLFSDKLFRSQLSYFDDIDYSEEVDYLVSAPSDAEIKSFLIDLATTL